MVTDITSASGVCNLSCANNPKRFFPTAWTECELLLIESFIVKLHSYVPLDLQHVVQLYKNNQI